jgi:hypothetical protein
MNYPNHQQAPPPAGWGPMPPPPPPSYQYGATQNPSRITMIQPGQYGGNVIPVQSGTTQVIIMGDGCPNCRVCSII